MFSVVLNPIMLSVVMLIVLMLRATLRPIMLSVVMLNVVILNVVAPGMRKKVWHTRVLEIFVHVLNSDLYIQLKKFNELYHCST
jgi:hypothetical protein